MASRLSLVLIMTTSVPCFAADVALVTGTYASAQNSTEAPSTAAYADVVSDALTTAGIAFDKLGDEDVAAGKLEGHKIAVFAYTPLWAPGEAEATIKFIQAGGKIMVFYTVPSEVLAALGFRPTGYQRDDGTGLFHACRLAEGVNVQGLPAEFVQKSWNINAAEPAREDARVLYTWQPREGQAKGQPAALLSESGFYMTHVLTRDDLSKKARMLFAVVAHFLPDLWPQAAQRAVDQALAFDAFQGLEGLESLVRRAGARANNPGPSLQRTREAYGRLRAAVEEGRYAEAIEMVDAVRAAATETYARCQQPRPVETRAVWIHTAFGVADWGWEKSVRHLKEKGFNAIFPNMCWGGVAYYESQVLPVHESVKERGDQVRECLKWCRRYGVELHVWKVNWNLGGGHTPDWFREKLRAEGRLQRDPAGKEIDWLCPSDDRNFVLERDAMLELVRKYHVDGIHFDYIRYPGYEGCFCDRCRAKFEERIGRQIEAWPQDVISGPWRAEWLQFRRDNISRLVEAVAQEAHRIDRRVKVSAAVFGWWDSARDSVGQDWVRWVDEGWLDFACPMDYIPDNGSLDRIVTKQTQWIGGRIPLYIGLGEWILKDAAHLVYQASLTRARGADGFVLFHYDHPELTGERMDMMALGMTREAATWPHRGPKVEWVLPEGVEGPAPRTYLEGAKVTVEARLEKPLGRSGTLELRSLDGDQSRKLATLSPTAEKIRAQFTMEAQPVRLAVVVRDAKGKIVAETRSPILWVLTKAEYEELQARKLPPKFTGTGLAVGVYQDGYGGPSILNALDEATGIEAKPLWELKPDHINACRAVILAQPRRPEVLTPETVAALRAFVEAGGTLIVTHDAVGFRRCPVIAPEVCAGGVERADDTTWKLVVDLPESGLNPSQTYEHTFYDHIVVVPGASARVIATDVQGRPLIAAGRLGRGKVWACGLAIGVGPGDADVAVSAPEAKLLHAALTAAD